MTVITIIFFFWDVPYRKLLLLYSLQVDYNYLNFQEFFIGDIRVGTERHIVFATELQLQLLKQARRWFLDGTFKIRKEPFQQLFSLHSFVQKDDCMKQVPLMFSLMTKYDTPSVYKLSGELSLSENSFGIALLSPISYLLLLSFFAWSSYNYEYTLQITDNFLNAGRV